ncbi:MAG: exodeoxyribonuclease VII small subunit [Christensenella sp.]|nr:exodeoxyribonuclease VII small subunit [Christensenella sp.]
MAEKDLETYMEELKQISEKISAEDVKLAEAISLYKKGAAIAEKASTLLQKYESELEVIEESGKEE